MPDFHTPHLAYWEPTGLTYLRPHGFHTDDAEICLGALCDLRHNCPRDFLGEASDLIGQVMDSRFYGLDCRATAEFAYAWGRDSRGW